MIDSIQTLPSLPSFNTSQEDPSRPTVIIHIGLPKTATTTLQERFFNKIERIHYLGKPSNRQGLVLRSFLHNYPPPYDILRNNQPPFFSLEKPNLFSEETIYRCIFHDHKSNLIENLKKINRHCNLKLIITTRAQDRLIPSYYLFKICSTKTPNTPFEERIFLTNKRTKIHNSPSFPFQKRTKTSAEKYWEVKKSHDITYLTNSSFDYLHLYQLFNEFIPKKNLLMLPMEGILSEDFSYREKLFHFITQRKASEREKELLKTFHLYQDNPSPHPHYKKELQRFKDMGYAQRVFNIYKDSNQKLAALLKLPLKKFGYY